jgi:hypothetical protein
MGFHCQKFVGLSAGGEWIRTSGSANGRSEARRRRIRRGTSFRRDRHRDAGDLHLHRAEVVAAGDVDRPPVVAASLKPVFFLFHEFQDSFILILIQPIAVSTFAKIHFKVVCPVLKSFHQFTTLGALTSCCGCAEDQTTFLVVAEIEDFIFKLFQFLAETYDFASGAINML